jgi:hypothetical protein
MHNNNPLQDAINRARMDVAEAYQLNDTHQLHVTSAYLRGLQDALLLANA